MTDDEILLVVLAGAMAAMEEEQGFRPLMRQGGGETPAPVVPPTGLNAFQTDAFQNDAFE